MAQRDVQLVINAQDNTSRVAKAVTSALDALAAAQRDLSSGAPGVSGAIKAVADSLVKLEAAGDRGSKGFDRAANRFKAQKTGLEDTRSTLAQLETSADKAGAALFRLSQAQASGDAGAGVARKKVLADYEELASAIPRVVKQIANQETQLNATGRELLEYRKGIDLASSGLATFGSKAERVQISVAAAVEGASNDLLRLDRALSKAKGEVSAGLGNDAASARNGSVDKLIADSNRAAQAFDKQIAAQSALTAEVERFRDRLDPARAAQAKLDNELVRAKELYRDGKISIRELVAEQARLAQQATLTAAAFRGQQNGSKALSGLFGLRPYELQNLGYQVNDLVTQVASGTSLTQALAQQGGQILQLFPQALSGVLQYGRAIGLIGVAIIPVFLGLSRLFAREADLRSFNAQIAATGEASLYQGNQLAQAARNIDQYGASIEDAKAAVSALAGAGINPDQIEAFGRAAQNASDVLGIKLVDAAKDSAQAFTGGYKAVAEFDNKLNFLTESEREQIQVMFESGQEADARAKAFQIFYDKFEDASVKARGSWAQSVRALQQAWSGFLDYLANSTVIKSFGQSLTDVATGIAYSLNKLSGANALQTAVQDVTLLTNRLNALKADASSISTNLFGGKSGDVANYTQQLKEALKRLADLQRQQKLTPGGGLAGTVADPKADSVRSAKVHNDRMRELQEERAGIGGLITADTIRVAGQKAYRDELNKNGDTVAANFARETAVSKERAKLAKQDAASGKRNSAQAARDAKTLAKTTALIAPVSGRVTSGFGPRKSPGGVGTKFHKGNDFGVATGTSVKAVADGRATVTRTEKGGLTVTLDLGNGYKAAFLHLSQALVKTGDVVQQGQVIAKSGNSGTATTGAHLHYALSKNGDALDSSKTPRINVSSGTPFQEAADAEEKLQLQTLEAQVKINDELNDDIEKRTRIAQRQSELNALQGEALIAAQRQQFIEDALATAKERVAEQSETLVRAGGEALSLTEQQLAAIKAVAAAEFDASNVKARAAERELVIQNAVNVLLEQRQQLQESIQFAQQQGQPGVVGQLETQLDSVNLKLVDATAKAIAYYTAIRGNPTDLANLEKTVPVIDNIILGMQNAQAGAQRLNTQFIATGKSINETFAQGAVSAIDSFAQAVASGANVFDSLLDGFLQFASEFLLNIAKMILQQAFFNAISGGGGSGGGGAGGAISGLIAGLFHEGGVVGSGGGLRAADASWFTNAKRYHSGGIAGLAPSEVPAILQRGEEVLTANDPRHVGNGGLGGGGKMPDIKVVNTIDAGDFVSQGLGTKVGEKAILNLMRANPRAFKSAMGA